MSTSPGKFFYFAFGSNLLRERLKIRNPSAVYKTIAKLNNYSLSFSSKGYDASNSLWRGAGATILKNPGHHVWGVVWEVGEEDLENLDRQEKTYNAINVEVVSPEKETYICRTYQKDQDVSKDNRPSPQYKDIIIRGAIQSELPEDYINSLKRQEDNGFDGSVEIYDSIIKQIGS